MSSDDRSGREGTSGEFQFGSSGAHVVEFHLGTERCAIDTTAVDGIVEMKQITRVPRAPDAVDGVMDLRGETTAVVNPKSFLSVGERTAEQNVLVLDREEDKQKIGIRVDGVCEVTSYSESRLDPSAQLGELDSRAVEDDLVKGIIRKPVGDVDDDDTPDEVTLVLWLSIERLVSRIAGSTEAKAGDRRVGSDIQS
ncbi:MAG: chemotaxis protein CheW [Halodesulfurarchaeum sp.]